MRTQIGNQLIQLYPNQYMIFFDELQFSNVTENAICAQDIPAGTAIPAADVIRLHQSFGPATEYRMQSAKTIH